MTVHVHIKNNHARPDTFPPTPEAEPVFTTHTRALRTGAHGLPLISRVGSIR